jgi:phosphatidylserine/phosphatidylglycerophosphate/cardiolipin synthase-like enzyme
MVGARPACKRLQIRWYSDDGRSPILGNGAYASHAKYMSIDDRLAIVGSANMDTQAWNNSHETNVIVDDAATTQAWDQKMFSASFSRGIDVDACRGALPALYFLRHFDHPRAEAVVPR